MNLILKDYQKKTIGSAEGSGALDTFFELARGARGDKMLHIAFNDARRFAMGEQLRDIPYRPLVKDGDLVSVPQVCIRIPTGGGKTLLAAHAIERAARLYVGAPFPIALWMVPSNIIRTQTRDALRTPGHPYNDALLQYWPADRFAVLDIAECEQVRAQDFGNKTLVIVCTMQTLRVGNTASRDVYSYKESFEPHFSGVRDEPYLERIKAEDVEAQPYLKELLGQSAIGRIKYSFANLLALYRPIVIVIVDEAHNNTTPLSNEVFQRIRPSCIIEWTATPASDQNVVYHVSAQELKAENMIKLPIVLSPHPNWQEAVRDAVASRDRLAQAALGEADYVRPIVLFQAQPKDGEVTFEVLKTYLMTELHIEERRIAIATGNQRELDSVNLFDPTCPIEFVITIEALKEGWDCSFAYVFCTVQNIRSSKDMEQLLGRVLRLPYAKQRRASELNRAYAHVCASNTAVVANQLADRLVAMGFEEMEVATFIQPASDDLFSNAPNIDASLPSSQFEISPALATALQSAGHAAIVVATSKDETDGSAVVTVTGLLSAAVVDAVVAAAPKKEQAAVKHMLERHQVRALAAQAPAQRGVDFGTLPQLVVSVQGELCLLEPSLLTEHAQISLKDAPADLPDFSKHQDEKPYLIDLEHGKLKVGVGVSQYGLDLNVGSTPLRREDVIRMLDYRVRRDDILQPDMIMWIGRVIDSLQSRGVELSYCARNINQLAELIGKRLGVFMREQRNVVFQHFLFDGPAKVRLSDFYQFKFRPDIYPARWLYEGRFVFQKHFYALPGELESDITKEETACAIEIDNMHEVKLWVRNLEKQPDYSFWLPTSTDRFYPDFVARLGDGRLFAIEYKGGDRYSNDDSKEKRDIGGVWAAASNGKCLFAMVTDAKVAKMSVGAQLRRALS